MNTEDPIYLERIKTLAKHLSNGILVSKARINDFDILFAVEELENDKISVDVIRWPFAECAVIFPMEWKIDMYFNPIYLPIKDNESVFHAVKHFWGLTDVETFALIVPHENVIEGFDEYLCYNVSVKGYSRYLEKFIAYVEKNQILETNTKTKDHENT